MTAFEINEGIIEDQKDEIITLKQQVQYLTDKASTDEDTSRNIIEGLKDERDEAIKMLRKLNDAIDSCIELTPELLRSVQVFLSNYKNV